MIMNDLTQDKLARLYNCNRSFVSMALNGQRKSKKALAIKQHVLNLMNGKKAA